MNGFRKIAITGFRKIAITVVLLLTISLNGAMAQNVGTYSGDWSGTVPSDIGPIPVNGEWRFIVFDSGSLAGWFTGDGAGDIRGEVSDGVVSASGEGSAALGAVSWSGEFSGSSCSGTWSVDTGPGSGTWSGEKISNSIMVPLPGDLPPFDLKENASIRIGDVGPGNPIGINISNSTFSGVNIDVKNDLSDVTVNMSKVSKEFDDIGTSEAYKAMNISSNVANEEIENASIDFSVAKEWLSDRGYSKENVSLLRIHEEQQEKLSTEFTGE
ncbi:MAG: PGF-pre-PGF domain-containing protein, partial [Archaeoglobaceae archaeon]